MKSALFDFLDSLCLVLSRKGRNEVKKLIKYNPKTVHIDRVFIALPIEHLRRNVLHCATKGVSLARVMHTTPEITDLNSLLISQKDVLQLQISMHNMARVHVGYCLDQLLENQCDLLFREHFSLVLDYLATKVLK